jgi:hypothetical protein
LCLLAASQLGRYLTECRAHVEAFQASMIETRSAATALNQYKVLPKFFK